jgi:UPF0716 family protein affecting phage T7 exclusion
MGAGVVKGMLSFLVDVIGLIILVSSVAGLFRPVSRWLGRHQRSQLRFAVFTFVVYLCDITWTVTVARHLPLVELAVLLIVGSFIRSTATVIRAQDAAQQQHPSQR